MWESTQLHTYISVIGPETGLCKCRLAFGARAASRNCFPVLRPRAPSIVLVELEVSCAGAAARPCHCHSITPLVSPRRPCSRESRHPSWCGILLPLLLPPIFPPPRLGRLPLAARPFPHHWRVMMFPDKLLIPSTSPQKTYRKDISFRRTRPS